METLSDRLANILRSSLQGSQYDVRRLDNLQPDSRFENQGIDSLDMAEFFLRVQDECNCRIKTEDFSTLVSIAAVQAYVEQRQKPRNEEQPPDAKQA